MDIVISNSSPKPIYEQIKDQIKSQIMSGCLKQGDALPSMRALAQDLKISLITTKRAYSDLESEGFIETVTGKGSFVSGLSRDSILEVCRKEIEENIVKAVETAKRAGVSRDELVSVLNILYDDD